MFKIALWLAVFVVLSLLSIVEFNGPIWLALLSQATLSVFLMVISMVFLPVFALTRRKVYRLERRTGILSFSSYAGKVWVVAALMVTVVLLSWLNVVNKGVDLMAVGNDWRIFLALTGFIGLAYWLQRLYLKQDAQDKEWPPTVTAQPMVFRRAAQRLYERLTTWLDWRRPRSRLQQEQAVSVYLRLAEVRLELKARGEYPWKRWLVSGLSETGLPAFYLAWTMTTAGIVLTAFIVRLRLGDMPAGVYLLSMGLLVVAVACTMAAIVTDFRIHRKHQNWLVDELTLLQAQLGPLIFMKEADLDGAHRMAEAEPSCPDPE